MNKILNGCILFGGIGYGTLSYSRNNFNDFGEYYLTSNHAFERNEATEYHKQVSMNKDYMKKSGKLLERIREIANQLITKGEIYKRVIIQQERELISAHFDDYEFTASTSPVLTSRYELYAQPMSRELWKTAVFTMKNLNNSEERNISRSKSYRSKKTESYIHTLGK